MNNTRLFQRILLVALSAVFSLAASTAWAKQKSAAKETRDQFFIVSEVNLGQHQVVFEAPTQITATMTVTEKTVLTDRQGKKMPISDLRAGDTGYLTYVQKGDSVEVISFRLGPMTMPKLRADYLEGTPPPVPVTAAPVAPASSSVNGRGGRRGPGGRFGGRRGSSGGGRFRSRGGGQ